VEDVEHGVVLLGEGNGEGQGIFGVVGKIGGKKDSFYVGHALSSSGEEINALAFMLERKVARKDFLQVSPGLKGNQDSILFTLHNLSRWKLILPTPVFEERRRGREKPGGERLTHGV
jgi:hypothetical protein